MSSDRLEQQIVDALRRAPGPEPGAALDTAILARARAAVATPRRPLRPRWLSLAAGIVVVVGSGLALRIWQQVEHSPSALDVPTRSTVPSIPTPAPAAPIDDAMGDRQSADATSVLRRDTAGGASATGPEDGADEGQLTRGRSDMANQTALTPSAGPARDDMSQAALKQAETAPVRGGADMAPAAPKAEAPLAASLESADAAHDAEATSSASIEDSATPAPAPAARSALAESAPPAPVSVSKPAPIAEPVQSLAPAPAPAAAPDLSGDVRAVPAPPAEPFPGDRKEDASLERSQPGSAVTGATLDLVQQATDIQQRIARIRELLSARRDELALAEWQALRRDHPQAALPTDLQSALERLERKP